jgi:ferredoxin-NADP reductase
MQALPNSGISEDDAGAISAYLVSQLKPKGDPRMEAGRALVDQRCGRCHSLDRVYKVTQSAERWRATVDRMAGLAEGSTNALQPGEADQILEYLAATQTPESAKSRVVAAAITLPPSPRRDSRRTDTTMIGFMSIVGLGALTLLLRRPSAPKRHAPPSAVVPAPAATPAPAAGHVVLRLAGITPQTHDAKTLRFVLPEGQQVHARPGQFLTFSFLFEGKKAVRSYSICSSAARTGYIEITPKRAANGCASVYLNDHAQVGLTVEAQGPFGNFCLNPATHRRIVLLAGGSGITPFIAMLRYIEDLCLDVDATLLYAVRTPADIIFESELKRLEGVLPKFRREVLVSESGPDWSGARGPITREFFEQHAGDSTTSDFFMCGPPGFMDACRSILTAMGVPANRILDEAFGARALPGIGEAASIEFARSGKTCHTRPGQTVLEAAEEQGVAIPSLCRAGQCGTCKTRLLEGKVRMASENGLDANARAQGFVLTCVGRAEGPIKLDA